jgi:putative transposase
MRITDEARAQLVRRLERDRERGQLRGSDIRAVANACGVTERTVWRWLHGPQRKRGPIYHIQPLDTDALVDAGGNATAAWATRRAAGAELPSLRTFQRAVMRQLLPGQRASLSRGVEGRRAHEVYLRWEAEHRNAVWEADHKELPVLVMPPRGQQARKPWVTLFLDAYSRAVMGWALSLQPSAASVLAALRMALLQDSDQGPFCGIPDVLRIDNGLEFAAESLHTAAAVLGFRATTLPPYTPHLRGKVERYHRTIDDAFIAGLPLHTAGPRAADGRLYGPGSAMSLALFAHQFAVWVRKYNLETPHAGLKGQTPCDRWADDATPLRGVAESEIRWLLLASTRRRILKDGVHFGGRIFIAPELNGRVGQSVEVRHMPHDLRQVEIFIDGDWLATARPQDLLSQDERDAILARRREDASELGRMQRRASRRARSRISPVTTGGVVEETTSVSAKEARRDDGRREDRLAKLGRTDLLGLEQIREMYREARD